MSSDAAERRRIRSLLDAAGLELSAIAGHANLLEPDAAERAANRRRLEATIDLAVDLAAPCVICMGYGSPEGYEHERHVLASEFGELARYAEPRGVIVALEPHVGQAFDLPEKVVWLMEAVGSPNFRLNFDNSHFEVMGCDLDDYVPLLVPFAVHTDLKDQRGRYPDHEFLVPGEGSFDYARYLRAMDAAGYSGCITVEISVMVQRRPEYDPAEVARRSFATLAAAEQASGVSLVHGVKA
jgi:sugar phosphate isomerase/epimerase